MKIFKYLGSIFRSTQEMQPSKDVEGFLAQYSKQVFNNAMKLRELLFANLPNINEEVDIKARLVAYTYGPKYIELICVIIPSKKGLKLGFNRGVDLPDPNKLLQGTGKISRYIEIKTEEQITLPSLQELLESALELYKQRITLKK